MIYASSVSTNMSAYEDLPGHHLLSIRNLIASTPDSSYPGSSDEESIPVQGRMNPEWDYYEIRDLEAFLSFQAAADYCLACSDDSSEGDYDPTRECFVAVIGEPGDDDNVAADAARAATAAVGPTAAPGPSTPEGCNLCKEAQALLEEAAVQQAESSASRLRSVASTRADGMAQQDHEASMHTPPANRARAPSVHDRVKLTPVKDRLRDTRGNAHDGDACSVLN